jgi:uncharacterized membrane protein
MRGLSFSVFLLIVAVAAGYVGYSGLHMPTLVASHFGASGIADAFMPRGRYMTLMLCVTILLPMIVALPLAIGLNNPNVKINLPNRDYWLAPERRADTVAYIRQQMMRFGVALLLFICFAHWLVVRANAHMPPTLSLVSFVSGLLVFAAYAIVWIALHYTRFRHVPK